MLDAAILLERAVAIPSPSGRERAVAEFLVGEMRGFADAAFVDEVGNAVARLGRGPLGVLFLGHLDTAPGEVPVRIEGGKLYGRGAVDAKGSFCAALAAAARLPEAALERLTLTLLGAVGEEAPGSVGARHALSAYPKPDLLIIGEPSGWEAVTLGYKGRLVARLRLEKDEFHSAGPDRSAAEEVVALWQRLSAWAEAFNAGIQGRFDQVQLALQEVHGGSDGLRQVAEAVVSLRLPPALPPEAAEAALRALLAEVAPPGLGCAFGGAEAPYRGPKDTPLTRAFRAAIRARGGRPRFKVKTGTSDMNVVAPHWRVPVLAYGPGDSALDHRPDEHLELAEYERAIGVLADALERLAHGGADQSPERR